MTTFLGVYALYVAGAPPTCSCRANAAINSAATMVIALSGTNKTKVRLACIDAPETSQAPYGNDARRALQGELAIGAEVSLRTKATDRYGRTVALIIQILISHTKSEGCTIGKLINFYSRQ
jgi:endonuclease YncB( thermonuclease family)